jgi:hypothetical protein
VKVPAAANCGVVTRRGLADLADGGPRSSIKREGGVLAQLDQHTVRRESRGTQARLGWNFFTNVGLRPAYRTRRKGPPAPRFLQELNGRLKSWGRHEGAILNPADLELPVHVEDHPLAYGDF